MRGAPWILLAALAIAAPAAASAPDTLTFTMPDSFAMPESPCDSMAVPEQGLLGVLLERMRSDEFDWQVVDSLLGLQPGQPVSMHIDITGCRPCAFRLWVIDEARNPGCLPSRTVNRWELGEPVGVGDPPAFQLGRVTPMPVRRLAVVEFQLARESEAVLELFDLSGRRVRTLVSGAQAAGHHLALLDAGQLPAGLYLLRLRAGERQALRRLVVMR
jgi:hypothetical protein